MDDGADDRNERSRASYLRPQGIFSPLVVDYYNRFGRGRELEQYFSLMTASPESDVAPVVFNSLQEETNYITLRDPVPQTENRANQTTDLGLQPMEVPKIDPADEKVNPEEQDVQPNLIDLSSDYDSSPRKVDKNQLEISSASAKQVSPSGSVSSHRKLEWDSLADVGYDNEGSSKKHLSSIEKIALKHRFKEKSTVKSDGPQEVLGEPAATSTPISVELVQHPTVIKKTISISPVRRKSRALSSKKTQKRNKSKENLIRSVIDEDLNLDKTHPPANISVNLTRQYHLNFEFDQGKHDNAPRNEAPEIIEEAVEKIMSTKESQTNVPEQASTSAQTHEESPIVLSLKSPRAYAFKLPRKKPLRSGNRPQPTAAGTLARADSFEYMPGHVYQMQANEPKATSTEYTSSNDSSAKPQRPTDLDKCASLLSKILEAHQNDEELKKRLVKNVVKKLLKTRYVEDETTDSKISSSASSNDVILLKRNLNYTDSSASRSDRQSFRDLMGPKTKSEREYLKMKHQLIQKKMGDVRRKDSALEQLKLLQDEMKKLLLDSESTSKDDPRIASLLDRIVLLSTSIARRRKPPESADDDQSLPEIPPLILRKSSDESETSNKSEAREKEVDEIFVSNRQQNTSSEIIKRSAVEFRPSSTRPSSTRSLPIFKKSYPSGRDEKKLSSGRKSTTLEDSVSLLASPLIAKDKEFLRTIRDLLRDKPTLPPDEFNSKLKQKFEEMKANLYCDPDCKGKSIPNSQNETNEHETEPKSKLEDSETARNRHICCDTSCKHRLDPRLKERPCCDPRCDQRLNSSESEPSSKLKDSGDEKTILKVHICCNPSCEYRLDLRSKRNKTKEHSCCNPYCEQQQKLSGSEPSSKLKDSCGAKTRIKEHICCNPACKQRVDPLQSKSPPKLCGRCGRLRTQHASEEKPTKSSKKDQPSCYPTCTCHLDLESGDGRRKEHRWINSNSSDSDLNSILRYLCKKKNAAIKERICRNPQCQKRSKSVDPELKSAHKNRKPFELSDSMESQLYKNKQNRDERCPCPKHLRSTKQSKATQIKSYPTPIAYNLIFEPHNEDNPQNQNRRRKPLPEVKLRVPKFGEWFDYYRNGEAKEIQIENYKENVYCKCAPERESDVRGTMTKRQGSMQRNTGPEHLKEASSATSANANEVSPGTSANANEVSPGTSANAYLGSPGTSATAYEVSPGFSANAYEVSPGTSANANEVSPDASANSPTDDHNNIRTLQEHLAEKNPAFFQCAERRRRKIKENKEQRTKSTEKMNEMMATGIPTPENITKFYNNTNTNAPLIDDREMKERTTKTVQNLPESQAKNEQIRKEALYKSYLIKTQIFKKGLQIKTLKGQVNLPIRKTIMTL